LHVDPRKGWSNGNAEGDKYHDKSIDIQFIASWEMTPYYIHESFFFPSHLRLGMISRILMGRASLV
jgi:hypothetical protein